MNWHYSCPICGIHGFVPWKDRESTFTCHSCKRHHKPPTPGEQPSAYVDTHEWPEAMAAEVVRRKGAACTVPGCTRRADTLDHRVAWSKGGRTSVANLFPMCTEHNQEKGDKDYETWLAERQRAAFVRRW